MKHTSLAVFLAEHNIKKNVLARALNVGNSTISYYLKHGYIVITDASGAYSICNVKQTFTQEGLGV